MADSVTSADIPSGFQMVAGYLDGRYAWSAADWRRHQASVLVHIVVNPANNAGDVLDVEPGDATPAQALGWVRMRRKAGAIPALYASRSVVPTIEAIFKSAGEPFPLWWIAEWTGVPHQVGGSIATQYDHPPHSGGHYDLSSVADYWPGVDIVPPKPPAPPPVVTPPPPQPPPTPLPAPPPPAPPADAGAAQGTFWSLIAEILTHGLPRLLNDILAQVRKLRDL